MKLYCLPYAGASASVYTSLEYQSAGQGMHCIAMEYPGHGSRMSESLCRNISELATDVVDQVIASKDQFCLYGHSLGGHLAYEEIKSNRLEKPG